MPGTTKDLSTDFHLHLVCLDVPYPVDYGGVFDIIYKMQALHENGVKIHLHCFEYGRGKQPALEQWCEEVNYYERSAVTNSLSNNLPYIVASRANKKLLNRLQQDDYPVLMEGMHCTWPVQTGALDRKRCFVRLPNVEYKYYRQLAESTHSLWKKMFFRRESTLLKKYESSLKDKADFWTLSSADLDAFVNELGYHSIDVLPLYLPNYDSTYQGHKGYYCLYHGNLGISENEEAALWLLEEIFSEIEIPFVVAGKNPSNRLKKLAHQRNHTCIVANPDEKEMTELIRKAQLHILPSMNETGIKLKLVNALFNGRHCLVNNAGVEGSGLNDLCMIANNAADMRQAVVEGFDRPFTIQQFEQRMNSLHVHFNNQRNAKQMISWIFKKEPTFPGSSLPN